jgi:hypothetical protein
VYVPCEVPEVGWRGGGEKWRKLFNELMDERGGTYIPSSKGSPRTNPLLWKASMASSTVHFKAFIRAYRGIRASLKESSFRSGLKERYCRFHLPARSSQASASSLSVLAPRLIFTRCHSLRRRVLCRSIACLTGPSPAWMPPERRRSWTSTRARLWEVIFFSCFKRLAAVITSPSAGLSSSST